MKTQSILLLCSLFTAISCCLYAQEAIPATGGNQTGSNGSVSFTVGQVSIEYQTGTTGKVSQGVQQPYEIFLVTSSVEIAYSSLECEVYPNPASDFLILKISGFDPDGFSWQLCDAAGRLLKTTHLTGPLNTIPMADYKPGIYLFSVINTTQKQIKTFRIIKH
jgi:hypothetical protein